MDVHTMYRVVFYVNSTEEIKNLVYGIVKPSCYNYQVLSKDNERIRFSHIKEV